MSGGAFDYKQYNIDYLIEEMEGLIVRLNKEPNGTFECNSLKDYVENKKKFKKEIKKNIKFLKLSRIYTHRIDWFISGDDGEDSFYERLKEDLERNKNDVL